MSTQSVNMATFLKLESRNTVNRSERFRTTREELTFILTSPIDSIDWPLAFSEYIVDHIKDGASPTDHFGITIKHQVKNTHLTLQQIRLSMNTFKPVESTLQELHMNNCTVSLDAFYRLTNLREIMKTKARKGTMLSLESNPALGVKPQFHARAQVL
ncbi:hypothetical protein J6590_014452 [Homalodisca vitripennis]|nr:hypothetical protein J6590_014452 [Homalodisca vitripennis]